MAQISINNGHTFVTAQEALAEISLDAMLNYMDDDTREKVHFGLAPCTDIKFLEHYLELAPENLIIG